ncbi:MAG: hypothetical protein J5641_02950 [Bacteroidales bacterium]|nr:hypothetical protein [Bacteroidales bacterium]
MKNKNIFTFVLATAVVMFFSACQKEKSSINMNANIVNYGNNGSKVYVDGNHYANWNNGDKVMINGVNYTVAVSGSGSSAIASINGVAVNEDGYYAIYPSDRAMISSSGYPSILMPQVQIYEVDAAGNQLINAPMAAYCPSRENGSHSLDFVNLCSLIEVNVPAGTEVAYINVTSNDNFLWGKATIEGDANPVLSMQDGTTESVYTTSNKTVTLDCTTNGSNGSDNNGGSTAATGVTSAGPFYVVVPARSYSALTVDVYVFATNANTGRRDVELYTKAVSGTANVASNMIYAVSYSGDPTPIQPPYPYLGTGEFSVSPTKKVRFSMGNLQHKDGVWRFAENELVSYLDAENHNKVTGDNRSHNWIDLFGFGTSGKGSPSYSPTTYAINGSYATSSIAGSLYDWGVNEISNGGNQPNKWRTLTLSEWQYLIARPGHKHIGTVITKNNNEQVVGYIVAPDESTFDFDPSNWQYTSGLHITETEFYDTYRSAGCIFLPLTGYYSQLTNGNIQVYVNGDAGKVGYYWASTLDNGSYWAAKIVVASNGGSVSFAGQGRTAATGCAVRLVRDVD